MWESDIYCTVSWISYHVQGIYLDIINIIWILHYVDENGYHGNVMEYHGDAIECWCKIHGIAMEY